MKYKYIITLLVLASANNASGISFPSETMRSKLADANLEIDFDSSKAVKLINEAEESFKSLALESHKEDINKDLIIAKNAAEVNNKPLLVEYSTRAWMLTLLSANIKLESEIKLGNAAEAKKWLNIREYRTASKFTRLSTDAFSALEDLEQGKIDKETALKDVRSDTMDAYQSRLNDSLRELEKANTQGLKTVVYENKALARGYFMILSSAYSEQRGQAETKVMQDEIEKLPESLDSVKKYLENFRAAPMSNQERSTRTSQALRFLSLVPVEYNRGVKNIDGNGVITREVELNEARTFLNGSVSAFSDLVPVLPNHEDGSKLMQKLSELVKDISKPKLDEKVIIPADLELRVNDILNDAHTILPSDWQKRDSSADIKVVRAQLDATILAAKSKDWTAAENARIDAYSLLESGTEARIAVFNPEMKSELENLIWNGVSPKGLAALIKSRASEKEFKITRSELDKTLDKVSKVLGTEVAPTAVATNAGVIVFREGLEAVLILAALMGSLRKGSLVKLRRPMWLGALGAFIATGATWFVMQKTISLLGRYGEKLEAVISLIAIGVLLLIMNWFFHQVYWTDRMAGFQKHKHELTHGSKSGDAMRMQWWGLAVLGFTSIYREGFETVLFLQSLVLQAGVTPVLTGTSIGMASVLAIGIAVFKWQAKLPMKKLLIWTGVLICAVLGVMVGNTTHLLQLVGWMPVHPLPVALPAWLGLWLGLHSTWEGVILQLSSMGAVIGSFFAAEAIKEREMAAKMQKKDRGMPAGLTSSGTTGAP